DPGFALNHVLEGLYFLLARTDRPREHRAIAAEGRLREIPGFLELATETLGECPRVFVETALQVLAGAKELVGQIETHLRPSDSKEFEGVRNRAVSALESFERYLSDQLLEAGNGNFALGED